MLTRRTLLLSAAAAAATPALAAGETEPTVRRLSPKLDHILPGGSKVEVIATGIQWAEGPVWVPQDGGYLLFSDPPANIMRRWTRKSGVSVFLTPSGTADYDAKLVREAGSNGLALDREGRLLIANSGRGTIDRLDLKTRTRTVVADRFEGARFSSCNDIAVARSGAIYFTDPPYGFAQGDASPLKQAKQNGIYRVVEGKSVALVDGSLTRPNGLALTPDGKRLFVSNSDEKDRKIVVYDLGVDGLPVAGPKLFLDANNMTGPGNPDGMKIATDGTMFCSSPGGMWILAPDGEKLGLIEHGAPIANCCFGEDGQTLFLTANTRVLRVRLGINGWRA